jgi:hypothetical protein
MERVCELMDVKKVVFGNWKNAYKCRIGKMELIAVADIGPRILWFGLSGGKNVLFEDNNDKYVRKNWRLHGGHRFWIGPETENAFSPANDLCQASIGKDVLQIAQPTDPMGLQKILEISHCKESGSFAIRHIVKNVGNLLFPGCIWTLTVSLPGNVVVPWAAGSKSWQCNMVRYWKCWDGHTTDPASRQWKPAKDYFAVEPTGEEGKVGLYSERGFLALIHKNYTFVKTYNPIIEGTYPDGGSNIELFTCKNFVELETLSPMYTFHPGKEYCHTEHWILTNKTYKAKDWEKIKNILPKNIDSFLK